MTSPILKDCVENLDPKAKIIMENMITASFNLLHVALERDVGICATCGLQQLVIGLVLQARKANISPEVTRNIIERVLDVTVAKP